MKYSLYCDAAYNPVVECAGLGCVLYDEKGELKAYLSDFVQHNKSMKIHDITGAEAKAIACGLKLCHGILKKGDSLSVYTDNITVYGIMALHEKTPKTTEKIIRQAKYMESQLQDVEVHYIKEMRAQNHAADALAFAAINSGTRASKKK